MKRTNARDAAKHVLRRKWKWAGHIEKLITFNIFIHK